MLLLGLLKKGALSLGRQSPPSTLEVLVKCVSFAARFPPLGIADAVKQKADGSTCSVESRKKTLANEALVEFVMILFKDQKALWDAFEVVVLEGKARNPRKLMLNKHGCPFKPFLVIVVVFNAILSIRIAHDAVGADSVKEQQKALGLGALQSSHEQAIL